MTPSDIDRIIAEKLTEAIPLIIAQLDNSRTSGTVNEPTAHGCTYKTFMTCRPMEFNGTEGAIGVTQWIENIEAVFDICDCADNYKVKYASSMFQKGARTWWNAEVQARGRDETNALSWDELKTILIGVYCPKSEMQRIETELWNLEMKGAEHQAYTTRFHELAQLVPHLVTPESKRIDRYIWGLIPEIRGHLISASPATIQAAVSLAGTLTYNLVREGIFTETRTEFYGKKRSYEDVDYSHIPMPTPVQSWAANETPSPDPEDPINPSRGGYSGTNPKCDTCSLHHFGDCPICNKCGQTGHFRKHCRTGTKNRRTCHECGEMGHLRKDCPNKRQTTGLEIVPHV